MFTNKPLTKGYVATQNLAHEKGDALVDRLRDEEGEIASWMVVLGMLVAAAALAKTQIGGKLTTLINDTAGKIG